MAEKQIKIEVSDKAKEILADRGFDPFYGARPLKRVIQKEILDPLALKIITDEIKRNKKIKIDIQNNKFTLK